MDENTREIAGSFHRLDQYGYTVQEDRCAFW